MPLLTYISAFEAARTTAGGRVEAMPEREINYVNAEQKVARTFAFGEHSCVPSVASEQSVEREPQADHFNEDATASSFAFPHGLLTQGFKGLSVKSMKSVDKKL